MVFIFFFFYTKAAEKWNIILNKTHFNPFYNLNNPDRDEKATIELLGASTLNQVILSFYFYFIFFLGNFSNFCICSLGVCG